MSDRLQNLLRQRALIQEHLAWLEREISQADGVPSLPPPANRPPQVAASTTTPALDPASEAEKILGRFQKDPSAVQTDTRRGCLLIVALALGITGLVAIVAYYFYGRHLGRWW